MKNSTRSYLTATLAFLVLTGPCITKAQSNTAYGASDANGSYGDSGAKTNPSTPNNTASYGGSAGGSYGNSGAYGVSSTSKSSDSYSGDANGSYGNPEANNDPSTPNSSGSNGQDANGSYGSSASYRSQPTETETEAENSYGSSVYSPAYGQEARQSENSYGSPQESESESESEENYSNNESYEYDTNGSGGSYDGSSESTSSDSYGSPSASYDSSKVEDSYGSPLDSSEQSTPSDAASQSQTSLPTSVFPPSLLTTFAVDIHFVAGYDLRSSYIAFHFCSGAPNITQCDIYNGLGSDAKLIAVEMVVTEDVFQTFPEEERALWHSHEFPVTSGIFVLPELSPEQELEALQFVISTYGKVTNFYHPGQNAPIYQPQLAYGWATDAQVNADLVKRMEQILNLSTTMEQRKEARKNLKLPKLVAGHDKYLDTGIINQYEISRVSVSQETGEPQW